jgi:hypothetical protein
MDKQNALDQHRVVFLATLDFFLRSESGRVIVDGEDAAARHYEKLRMKAETHYQNGNLERLQQVMRETGGLPKLAQDKEYLAFIKERTGYDAETVQQILPERVSYTKVVTVNGDTITHKKLAELVAPDNKCAIIVREIDRPHHPVITMVDIRFPKAGASVYMVEGANLDITIYWKDNNTVIIKTRKEYVAMSKPAKQYQSLDDVVKVEYVFN